MCTVKRKQPVQGENETNEEMKEKVKQEEEVMALGDIFSASGILFSLLPPSPS